MEKRWYKKGPVVAIVFRMRIEYIGLHMPRPRVEESTGPETLYGSGKCPE